MSFNANLFGDGLHTARLLVTLGGTTTEVGSADFSVTTFDGQEFLSSASGQATVFGFPDLSSNVSLAWQEEGQSFTITGISDGLQSGDNQLSMTFSSTFSPTTIDVNGDGMVSSLARATVQSNFGPATFEGVGELAPVEVPTNCPAGNLEFALVPGSSSTAFTFANGDLLFSAETSIVTCTDLSTGFFTNTLTGLFIGGTGQLAGASGSLSSLPEATSLSQILPPRQCCGQAT